MKELLKNGPLNIVVCRYNSEDLKNKQVKIVDNHKLVDIKDKYKH